MAKGSKPGERRGGRAKGTPNKVTAATRDRIEREADPIGFLAKVAAGQQIEAATEGGSDRKTKIYPTAEQRMHAAGILARKVVPDAKDETIRIDLPRIEAAHDIVAALAAILQAVAQGEITPSHGERLGNLLERNRQAIETVELERRVADLERLTVAAVDGISR